MDSLNEVIKAYREPRNLFVHRGQRPVLSFFDYLERMRIENIGKRGRNTKVKDQVIENMIKTQQHIVIQDLYSETLRATDAIVKVLDALYPVYLERTARLKPVTPISSS
jgi:hypothetical protein